jgi:GrpB-like predicted nucleotidyltransferase (UPF0157 family)
VTSSDRRGAPGAASQGRPFRGGTILGAERNDPVAIVAYDPLWPGRFETWRERLARTIGSPALRIEHIGSTAVPGLAAKPVVDIQVSVPDVADEDSYVPAIESVGFGLRYRNEGLGWRYFRPPPGLPREAQVHVCSVDSESERLHLLFRDYLRAHPAEADAYAAAKRVAAARHRDDRIAYTDAKDAFIHPALRRAEAWAGETGWSVETTASTPPASPRPTLLPAPGPTLRRSRRHEG